MPDAGGLVIATDQTAARAYAAATAGDHRRARRRSCCPTTAASSARIARFAASDERWMVAVRMVSEGVDVPRLAVGVYATSASTPLYFAQAIGRFVRARRPGETASVFLPSVPPLLRLAGELEAVRDHVLGRRQVRRRRGGGWDDDLLAAAQAARDERTDEDKAFTALGASAHLDQVIFDGASFGTGATPGTPEEEDYLGLPGLLDPDQVAALLRARQAKQVALQKKAPAGGDRAGPRRRRCATHERRAALRQQLNALVAAHHHRTGRPHGTIHSELRRQCGGPPTAVCTVEQLEQRIATIQSW